MEKDSRSWGQCMQHAGISDIGMRRQNNQDSMNIMLAADDEHWAQQGHLFIVADGMGAHAAGELASKLAADGIPHIYSKALDVKPHVALQQSIHDANTQIHNRGQGDPEFQGMGTTCTALLLLPAGAFVGHVGDSRAYLLRGDQFSQLTFDHSLVWEVRAANDFAHTDLQDHLPKNVITRSLGPNADVQVDLEGPFPVASGDRFLLCSDGLTGHITDVEVGTILGCLSPKEATRALVDLANLRGGSDNITVIAVEVSGPPVADGSAVDSDEAASGAHPLLWMMAAVCGVAAVVMGLWGRLWPTIISGIGAAVALIVALLQQFESTDSADPSVKQGKGPYVAFDCRPGEQVAEALGKITRDLRQATVDRGLSVDLEAFDESEKQAGAASVRGEYADAIGRRCRAISNIMAELKKKQIGGNRSDSHVDLI